MPIYEYLCEACGTLTEKMQKVADPPPRTCTECGSRKIARLMSRTSFQLKGGGWYADLYASPRPADAAKKDGAEPATGGTGSAKGDAGKPEAPGAAPSGGGQGSAPRGKRSGRKAVRRGR